MYNPYARRRVHPLIIIIIIGAVGGLIFFVVDQQRANTTEVSLQATTVPTNIASVMATPSAETVQMPATPTIQPLEVVHEENDSRILIPAAGVSAPIIRVFISEGNWDITNLGDNVGHLQGTAWLDEPGNIVLSGHVELSSGGKGVFASLLELKMGDIVIIEHHDTSTQYVVNDIRKVQPNDLTPLYPTSSDQITLITCDDYNFISDSYEQRVIVVAEKRQT